MLAAHPVDNPIWDHTDTCDTLINTVNSAKALVGSHIVEPEYFIFRTPFPAFEDIKLFVGAPSDTFQDDRFYQFMNNCKEWDNSPNTTVVGNDT